MVDLRTWIINLQSSIMNRCDDMAEMIDPLHPDRQQRLEIYQNAYLLRLAEALEANYPCIYGMLGEDGFGRMMLAYLSQEKPDAASIRWFGHNLSAFLASHASFKDRPMLAEIASYEWAVQHTVDAADAPRCCYEDIASLDAEAWLSLEIILHPSVTLLHQCWNTMSFVHACKHNSPMPELECITSNWLIYRSIEGACAWRSMDSSEYIALSAAARKTTFPDLCETLLASGMASDNIALFAATCLRTWVDEGIVVSPAIIQPCLPDLAEQQCLKQKSC